jgi:hypothetical protein
MAMPHSHDKCAALVKRRKQMRKAKAFINGVREFRSDLTTHYDDLALLKAYDLGREWAHRLTLRRYDNAH